VAQPATSGSKCLTCTFVRHVHGRRGQTYLLCRNDDIPEKYPRQPVLTCAGYQDEGGASPFRLPPAC
jgi:hypothetical protein